MSYFLGVDVGGSKTEALIADDRGAARGFGRSGPGNHQGVGYAGLLDAVREAIDQALTEAGVTIDHLEGAGFGIGGYDWPSQYKAHAEALAPLGLKCPTGIANDSIIALLAGAPKGWGLVMIAGTGNNCRGLDRAGREARITGEGSRFGEHGGGGEMVQRALHAVAHAWSRRGPRTALTDTLIELTGAMNADDLIEGIDLGRFKVGASFAETIFQVARTGDPVARELVAWSARELGQSACAVIRQLDFQGQAFDAVMAGSIFAGGDLYIAPLREVILGFAPKANLIRLQAPPVVGGVILAMQRGGIPTTTLRGELIQSTGALIAGR